MLFAVTAGTLLTSTGERGARAPALSDDALVESDAVRDAGPEAAVRMVDRLQLFRAGNLGSTMVLRSEELTALLRHAAPGLLPTGVSAPEVRIVGSELRIRARVSPDLLPGGGQLARSAMPDVVDVELRGRLSTHGRGTVAYRIARADVEHVPLPNSVVAALVRSWAGGAVEGPADDPRAMIVVRWPLETTRIRVSDGAVVLVRAEPILTESVDGIDGA